MNKQKLETVAQAIVATGKGILAADESTGTIKKRFDAIKVETSEAARNDYREMLFRTPRFGTHISGVILFEEQLMANARKGGKLVDLITGAGAIPGIKVDKGAKPLAGANGETITEGLDGLTDRCKIYVKAGAQFAKWRAVIDISGAHIPSMNAISTNMHALARYAAVCQETGLVPIVEPEVLMDGDHSIDDCAEVTETTLKALFDELYIQGVHLEGILLKPNMVISGAAGRRRANVAAVAERTVQCLKRTVPASVPGITFLSGGQSELEATAHLDAMNKIGNMPWALSFSYGRALQAGALKAWKGKDANWKAAQKTFAHRARMNGLAAQGKWRKSLEK